jgi:hypothetical protein
MVQCTMNFYQLSHDSVALRFVNIDIVNYWHFKRHACDLNRFIEARFRCMPDHQDQGQLIDHVIVHDVKT